MNPYATAESGYGGTPYGEQTYNGDNYEGEGYGGSFGSKAVRLAFIRKVYGILSVQLSISLGFICIFAIPEGVRQWSHQNLWILWVAFIVAFGTMMVLACCGEFRRKTPHNYIALMIFTLAESFLLGIIGSVYKKEIVLMAVVITAIVCFALTVFAFQTKIDFTVFNGIVFVAFIILMLFGFVIMFFPKITILHVIYSAIGALIFSAFLVIDTQMIMGGTHSVQISSEEYIFAALTLYTDIINLFLHILNLLNAASRG